MVYETNPALGADMNLAPGGGGPLRGTLAEGSIEELEAQFGALEITAGGFQQAPQMVLGDPLKSERGTRRVRIPALEQYYGSRTSVNMAGQRLVQTADGWKNVQGEVDAYEAKRQAEHTAKWKAAREERERKKAERQEKIGASILSQVTGRQTKGGKLLEFDKAALGQTTKDANSGTINLGYRGKEFPIQEGSSLYNLVDSQLSPGWHWQTGIPGKENNWIYEGGDFPNDLMVLLDIMYKNSRSPAFMQDKSIYEPGWSPDITQSKYGQGVEEIKLHLEKLKNAQQSGKLGRFAQG